MRPKLRSCTVVFVLSILGCSDTTEAPAVKSLERSGKVSLLCREMNSGEGREMRACPDSDDSLSDTEDRRTFALVTQTLRGEVAAIDLHEEEIVDEDPYIPGIEFMTIGANPSAIVSTPGGTATFVGTAEPGLEAIFALPTSCIATPEVGDPVRDVSLWSACRLPSAPGEMVIVADPTLDESGEAYRTTCVSADATDWRSAAEMGVDDRREDCPANLETEQQVGPKGRRKLVVTLPDQGKIAIYDAQAILNLPAGSFDNCVPDRVVSLSSTVSSDSVEQPIPDDLVSDASCESTPPRYTEIVADGNATAQPAGVALSGTSLYVADLGVPLIHTLDLSDPCAATEGEPLRPVSYDDPTRRVLTRDVAVSDSIPSGKQYLYALDELDGSAMVFDVSSDATSRAPVVRSHVPYLPFEPPDRIAFDSPIRDLLLVKHDVAAVNSANTAEIGVLCDPNPDAGEPGSLYRTDEDYEEGAAPRKLRGLFGVAALGTGQIAAIDIEDWDAPCRRPETNNPETNQVDWLGCANDPNFSGSTYETDSGTFTVTAESSCNVIEPHRVRSGTYFLTTEDVGSYAPNLSSLPSLSGANEAAQRESNVDRSKASPKMLAVPFEDLKCQNDNQDLAQCTEFTSTPPYLFVGTTKYEVGARGQSSLVMDPGLAEQNSLLLPMAEPRVYSSGEQFAATFEGIVLSQRQNGQLPVYPADQVIDGLERTLSEDELLLKDVDAWFCDQGVQDVDVSTEVGEDLGLSDESALSSFAAKHGDFVVLMSDFDEEDPYFESTAVSAACFDVENLAESCEDWFGTADDPSPKRELLIREAYHNQLVLVPRQTDGYNESPEAVSVTLKQLHCCFPSVHSYEIRAGNQWVVRGSSLLHGIVPGDDLRCVQDCSKRYSKLKNRAFEISSSADVCAANGDQTDCWIGPTTGESEEVCVTSAASGGVAPSELGDVIAPGCVFENLKSRFAIYRGLVPSIRDMSFSWTVNGGFSVLATSMVNSTTGYAVMPEQMIYSEALDSLVVVDGVSGGISLFGLGSFSSAGEPYQ